MKKRLCILLIVASLFFGVISYNALAVTHYDLDPVGVLASVLNSSIPMVGYVSGVASVVLLIGGIILLRA